MAWEPSASGMGAFFFVQLAIDGKLCAVLLDDEEGRLLCPPTPSMDIVPGQEDAAH